MAKLDTQLRFDGGSGQSERYQDRVRFNPSIIFDDEKMLNCNDFVATGDDFVSSYHTFDDDLFYLRRVYLRQENDQNKIEISILLNYVELETSIAAQDWLVKF